MNPSMNSRDARERESLNSSIRSSFAPRIPVEFESSEPHPAVESTNLVEEVAEKAGAVQYVDRILRT